MKNSDLFQHENDFPNLNSERAVQSLSKAIAFETVSYVDAARIRYRMYDGYCCL